MKNVVKSIVFLLILLVLIILTSLFFANFKVVKHSKTSVLGISGEYENSLDYLIIGDSETYTSTIPLEIWKDYGYAGYVCGTPGQKLNQTYDILKEALINQNPKVVVLETNAVFRKVQEKNDFVDFINENFQMFKYHDNWKYIVNSNLKNSLLNEKGYVYSKEIKKSSNTNYGDYSSKKRKLKSANIEYFQKILDLCKKNNIKLILLSVPTTKNWNYKKHNAIEELANKYDLKFIDLNIDPDINIDWENDTQDEGDHLNYYGALKVTKHLGKNLDDLKILKSHKNDKKYQKWNDNYDEYYKKYLLKFNNL